MIPLCEKKLDLKKHISIEDIFFSFFFFFFFLFFKNKKNIQLTSVSHVYFFTWQMSLSMVLFKFLKIIIFNIEVNNSNWDFDKLTLRDII